MSRKFLSNKTWTILLLLVAAHRRVVTTIPVGVIRTPPCSPVCRRMRIRTDSGDVKVGLDRHDSVRLHLVDRPRPVDAVGFCPACGDLRPKGRLEPFVIRHSQQGFATGATTSMGRHSYRP